MKKILLSSLLFISTLGLIGCEQEQPQDLDINLSFDQFKHEFIEELWQLYPESALYSGRYEFAGILTIVDAQQKIKEIDFWKTLETDLNAYDNSALNSVNASDWHIMQAEIDSTLWYLQSYQSESWNPSDYNVAGSIGFILNADYASQEERLQSVGEILSKVPAYYQAAQSNLQTMTIPHTELAIQQNIGAENLLSERLIEEIQASNLDQQSKSQLNNLAQQASQAINAYVSWLENRLPILEDGVAKSFRIGRELYEQKFQHDLKSGFTADQAYQRAMLEKDRLHKLMLELSTELWPKYFPNISFPEDRLSAINQVISRISESHASVDTFVSSVRDQIPELERFVIEHELLTIDPEKPLVVRETPEYQRGFSVASIQSPGPYDVEANTYYNVEPIDDYDTEQAQSHLREYNNRMMQILNIHEAIPGHYTQLIHANQSPSLIKSIFGNGTMIEGWAVYTERMMLEAGYGDFEPELWLMYYKWNLRTVVNTILDHEIQVLDLSEEEGLDLLMSEAFQEEAEATGKWRRATLSQVQLASYFTGYAEIYAFQQEQRELLGDDFDLKTFHDDFLSYGSAPIPIIKELMTR